jgi:exosome complex exonuclease DIS3/RRP44
VAGVVADEVIATLKNDDVADSDDEGEGEGAGGDVELAREREEARAVSASSAEKQPTGRVVGIVKRNWRATVCHIDATSLQSTVPDARGQQTVFATPVQRTLPRIRLRTRQAPALLGQKILVSIDRWDAHSRYPAGHFVRALGGVESKEAERESLLLEHDVPYRPFGKAILDCLPSEGDKWVVPPKSPESPDWKDREDLRDIIICSIDPPGPLLSSTPRETTTYMHAIGCQDIDDALHARRLPNGHIEAGVHIADVSRFVASDNPMDAEAAARGTTVYLVDQRIDMLPALLGTNLCSLRPYVERLAFSVIWVCRLFEETGRVLLMVHGRNLMKARISSMCGSQRVSLRRKLRLRTRRRRSGRMIRRSVPHFHDRVLIRNQTSTRRPHTVYPAP